MSLSPVRLPNRQSHLGQTHAALFPQNQCPRPKNGSTVSALYLNRCSFQRDLSVARPGRVGVVSMLSDYFPSSFRIFAFFNVSVGLTFVLSIQR
jgi:hypothetical protein